MNPAPASGHGRTRRGHRLAALGWLGLGLLQPLWHLWLLPPARLPAGWITLLCLLPLAWPLLAWRQPRRALLWAGTVSLCYFCHGVAEAWSAPAAQPLALLEIALCLLLIGGLGATVQRRRH